MTQPHNQLKLDLHIRNRDVDLLHADSNTGIDRHEIRYLGVEIDVCRQILNDEFDALNAEIWDVEMHIWSCGAGL